MKHFIFALFSFAVLMTPIDGFPGNDEKREALQAASKATLEQLYAENPAASEKVKSATGYAVFPGRGSSKSSAGILHDNHADKNLYMKMLPTGVASGKGNDYSLVLVFQTAEAMNNFKDVGWDVSGQGDSNAGAALTGVGVSGAQSVMQGTTVYRFNQSGMAENPDLQGIKFVMDEKLN